MLIVKRKYNKGYYVNTGGKVKHQESLSVKAEKKKEETAGEKEQPDSVLTAAIYADTEKESVIIVQKKTVFENIEIKEISNASEKEQKAKRSFDNKAEKQYHDEYDDISVGLTCLLVVMGFIPFVALVAVWIKDEKEITRNFWTTLLLHLFFFYWLFAMLVILDMVNLDPYDNGYY